MKKNLAFIAVILALAIWSAMLHSQTKDQGEKIAKLQQEKNEMEAVVERVKILDPPPELARAQKEHVELIKLRNEVGTLRTEKQKLNADLKQASSMIAVMKESLQRPGAQQSIQFAGQAPAPTPDPNAVQNACINNLRLIDGAKQQWALEYKKTADDVPTPNDLMLYITNKQLPVCPGGGSYIFGAVKDAPQCTLPGHVLP